MDASSSPADGLQKFAAANNLTYAETAQLPDEGWLGHSDGTVEGSVSGRLPGGLDGIVAHYTYTTSSTDSDGHTSTQHHYHTVVVGRLPESIGFAPYLSFRGPSLTSGLGLGGGKKVEAVGDAIKGASSYAFEGTSDDWLTQLFSPALLDWLSRSANDFGFELSEGVLCVARDNYLTGDDLGALSSDAAHVATAISTEAEEAIDSGQAATQGAHAKPEDPDVAKTVDEVVGEDVPEHLGATAGAFRGHLFASPGTYGTALLWALVVGLILNVFLLAITINLIAANSYTALVVFEGALLLICFLIALRWRVRDKVSELDPQAFFRGYARSRHLNVEDPLQFAATHAEAKLPFEPDWVFTGTLPGGNTDAALAVKGDGTKRDDRIGVIGGPSGPVASSELKATAPGLSLNDLDAYSQRLSAQLASQPSPAPA